MCLVHDQNVEVAITLAYVVRRENHVGTQPGCLPEHAFDRLAKGLLRNDKADLKVGDQLAVSLREELREERIGVQIFEIGGDFDVLEQLEQEDCDDRLACPRVTLDDDCARVA